MNTIIEGLHTCKPKNAPTVGQVKTFILEDRGNWMKVRNPDKKKFEVGKSYRITRADKTDYSDAHGNVSFSLELEQCDDQPTPTNSFQQTKQTTQNDPQSSEDAPKTASNSEDGVKITKAHLARSANLYNLVVDAALTLICPFIPKEQQTNEQFQSIVGQLFREVYTKRTDDGVNWYSYVDKMPIKPIKEAQPNEEPDIPF